MGASLSLCFFRPVVSKVSNAVSTRREGEREGQDLACNRRLFLFDLDLVASKCTASVLYSFGISEK
jgi:hypothetical protein